MARPMTRPSILTALGIINIAFAAMGMLGILISAVSSSLMDPRNSSNPVVRIMHENPDYQTFQRVGMVIGFPAAIVLLIAGIGLLQMQPWGRYLTIVYAIYGALMGVTSAVINYLWLFRPLLEQFADKGPAGQAVAIGGAAGTVLGGCFALVYPVILLVFMNRRNVIEAIHPERARGVYDVEPGPPGPRRY